MPAQLHVHPSEQTLLNHEKCSHWVHDGCHTGQRQEGKIEGQRLKSETVKSKRKKKGSKEIKPSREVLHFWNVCQQMVYKAMKSPFNSGFHMYMKARSSWTRFLQHEWLTSYQQDSSSWSVNRNPGVQLPAQVQLNGYAQTKRSRSSKCSNIWFVWFWQPSLNLPPFLVEWQLMRVTT